MEQLDDYKVRLLLVCLVPIMFLGSGRANADFTFGTPTDLGSTVNSSYADGEPHVSIDGLELYFNSNRPGGYGDWDIWVAKRQTANEDWGKAVNLGPLVNSATTDAFPCLLADGLLLYFCSRRPGGPGGFDIWVASRTTPNDAWGEPVNLGPPVNSSYDEAWCCIDRDGLELYFSTYSSVLPRPGGHGDADLWVTRRAARSDPWGEPVNLGLPVNSSSRDCAPSISSDGLSLFFASDRPGGYGNLDLWVMIRRNVSDPWALPINLGPIVNSPQVDTDSGISPDGATLYFGSDRVGVRNLWQAPILPIVDFNGDGIADAADMCIMVDHWGEYYPLCDIGPTPLGDGIVDVEDLIVLVEHLFEDVNDPTLIAHWPLDEAQGGIAYNNAADCDGTLMGGPVWQPEGGMVGGALQFDGVDDYVSTDPVLNPVDGKFSVLARIKGGAPGQTVISQTDGSNWLCVDSVEGCLMTELQSPGRSAAGSLLSQTPITDGQWHRIGLVWDGSCRHLYVDGVEVAKDAMPLPALDSTNGGLYFGVGSTLAPSTFFSGLIDDIRIYNRVVHP